jgi:hypothetical protein
MTQEKTGGNGRRDTRRSDGSGEDDRQRDLWKQRNAERLARKVENAKRDDMDVVSRRAMETQDTINLLRSNDYIIYQLRQKLGRTNGVPIGVAAQFLERNENLRKEMNLLNAEICKAMGTPYRAPRGFANPFAEKEHPAPKERPVPKSKQPPEKTIAEEPAAV